MSRIDKLPSYFDDLNELEPDDILILQDSSQKINAERAGIIIGENNQKYFAELENETLKLTLLNQALLSSTCHLFRLKERYQKVLSAKLSEIIIEHQKKSRNHKNAISFFSRIYLNASRSTSSDLQTYLYRNTNFQYFLSPKEQKNLYTSLVQLVGIEQSRLAKENKLKAKEKAAALKQALDGFQKQKNLPEDEIRKSIALIKALLPSLRINTGFGIRTPASYLKIINFAREQGLNIHYFDDDLILLAEDERIKDLAEEKYSYTSALARLYANYRKQGYSDKEAKFECKPTVDGWFELHKKETLALGLATFGFGVLLGSLPHAVRRVYEAEKRNEQRIEEENKEKEEEKKYGLQKQELIISDVLSKENFQALIRTLQKKHSKIETLKINARLFDWEVRDLADVLKYNTSLFTLDLRCSEIDNAGAEAFAEAFKANTSITTLNLSNNKISDAGVIALAKALKINKSLTTLYLPWGATGDAGAKVLAEVLKTNTSLTTLDLSLESKISDTGAKALAEALKTNTSLRTLNLGSAIISDAGVTALVGALKTKTSRLSMLTLYGLGSLGRDTGVIAIPELLKANTSLTTLNLSYNKNSDASLIPLAEALKTNTSLFKFVLSYSKIGDAVARVLAEALKTNISLSKLNLSNNKISDVGAQAFAEALKTNTSLSKLNLLNNKIGDAGAQAFAEALKINKSLTALYLSGRTLSDAGLCSLAEALKINKSLTTLYFSSPKKGDPLVIQPSYGAISDAGLRVLAEVLKTNTSLSTLNLMRGQISGAGLCSLAEALKINKSLTTLELGWNSVTGVMPLAEVLKTNTSLSTLNLRGNKIDDTDVQLLAEALEINKSLTTLDLSCNYFISDTGIQTLVKALKDNTSLITLNLFGVECVGAVQAMRDIKILLERNKNYKNIFEKLHQVTLNLKNVLQQTPSTKCIGEISKALENFSQIQSDLPQNYHRLEELKKEMNQLIPALHSWSVNPFVEEELAEEREISLLSVYMHIPPQHIAYLPAQFELAQFYRSLWDVIQKRSTLTESTLITEKDAQDYLKTLIGYLVHAENYNARVSENEENDKLETARAYDMLAEILQSQKIKQQMSQIIPAELLLKNKLISLIEGVREKPDTVKAIDMFIQELLASPKQATSSGIPTCMT